MAGKLKYIFKLLLKTALLIFGLFLCFIALMCFLGGPDPGAGSGSEGFTIGSMFLMPGIICIGFSISIRLKADKPDKQEN